MSTTFTKDDGAVGLLLSRVMATEHAALKRAGVTVEILLATNPDGPAVALHGWPCKAVIKVNSLKDRAAGCDDARLVIDQDKWDKLTGREREALIDHELTHLELVFDKEGEVRRDDLRRPKLKMKLHDWELSGFDSIVRRHRHHAPEAQSAARLYAHLKQHDFDWVAAEAAASGEKADEEAAA